MAEYDNEDQRISLASDHSPLQDTQSSPSSLHAYGVAEEKRVQLSRNRQSLLALWWVEILAAFFQRCLYSG